MSVATQSTASATIANAFLREFEQELKTTRTFIQRIPADKLKWQPHPKSMTAGQLAMHIAGVPAGVVEFSLQDEATPPDASNRPQPASVQEILDTLDRSVAYVRKTLPQIDDDKMQGTVSIVQGGQTLFSAPRAGFLRTALLNHWYHHRGQLGVYLRLLGASVPWSFGPSADESHPI